MGRPLFVARYALRQGRRGTEMATLKTQWVESKWRRGNILEEADLRRGAVGGQGGFLPGEGTEGPWTDSSA